MKKNLAEAAEARKFAEAKPQVSTTSYRNKRRYQSVITKEQRPTTVEIYQMQFKL